MELKSFISETLKQITEGIKDGHMHIVEQGLGDGVNDSYYLPVKFDVALSVTDEDREAVKGKIGIVNIFSTESGKENSSNNSTYSRIQFELTVGFKTKK